MYRLPMPAVLLAALLAVGAGGPALAANSDNAASQAQQLVDHAAQAVRNAEQNSNVAALMQQAKGVFIVPSYGEGSFLIGASGGNGVLLVREHGTWSDPAFYSIGSVSFGAQAGGKAGAIVMLLMTPKALNDFEYARNLALNGSSGLAVATLSGSGRISASTDDVVIWTDVKGVEGGVKVGGNGISRDQELDRQYYHRIPTTVQILQGEANNPKADILRNALPS